MTEKTTASLPITMNNSTITSPLPGLIGPARELPVIDKRSIIANIVSTWLLRIASRLSFMLLGFYLGEHFASATMVALVLEAFYISELLLSPLVGSLSDRRGRKPFLLAAPLLGAGAALCLLMAAQLFPYPGLHMPSLHLGVLLALILLGRLLEGATTALNTPASLGYIADVTTHSERWRARVMTAFEIATIGGLALAIPLGGKLSSLLGTWGFCLVIALHLLNVLLIILFVRESIQRSSRSHESLLASVELLKHKPIVTFLPAWLSINTLVGAWITLIILMLTYNNPAADQRFPGQLLYGGFSKELATMLVGGFGLLFLIGMGVWMFVLPRLRRTTVMLIGLIGLFICIAALIFMNGLADNLANLTPGDTMIAMALLPWIIVGVLLLSGFTPAALTQLGALSERLPGKRGAVMGLYSVVLGIGQLLGASVGGMFVDLDGFYGLMNFSILLGLLSLGSVLYMRMHGQDLLKS